MLKTITVFFFLLIFSSLELSAQINFALNQLFRTGIRTRYQYLPQAQLNDSTQFGFQQASLGLVVPLGGNVEMDFKDFKLQAKQSFLSVNIGMRQADFSALKQNNPIGNTSIGFTHLNGRVGKGVWVYTLNVGGLSDVSNWQTNIFALGGIAKLQIKGLRKQNIYGLAVGFNAQRPFIFPVIGWNRKLAKDWDVAILLPAQIGFRYHPNKKIELEWQTYFSTFAFRVNSTNFKYPVNNSESSTYLVRYADLRTGIEFMWKINRNWRMVAESGAIAYRNIRLTDNERNQIQKYTGSPTWYANLGLRFNFGKSALNSQLFGSDF